MEDGVVNDLNVRIRLEPNTKSPVLGKVQTGTNVKIIKQSEPYIADGKNNCWYQIVSNLVRNFIPEKSHKSIMLR